MHAHHLVIHSCISIDIHIHSLTHIYIYRCASRAWVDKEGLSRRKMRQREWGDKSLCLRQSAGLRGIGLPPMALIVLVFSFMLSSSPTECGIPLLHDVGVGGDRDKSKTCTHFSEMVSPSHGEVVAAKHFVLHVRCLAECGVTGAHVKIYLNEVTRNTHTHPLSFVFSLTHACTHARTHARTHTHLNALTLLEGMKLVT